MSGVVAAVGAWSGGDDDGVDEIVAEPVPQPVQVADVSIPDRRGELLDRARARPILHELSLCAGGYALLTLHRPTNVDDPEVLAGLLGAVGQIAAELPVVYPAHPRARVALESVQVPSGLTLIEPVGYLDSIALQAGARLVLTDSGGLQEETTVLGVPCLTLRTTTERPITISEGTNELVGVDPATVTAAARRVLADPPAPQRPALWDGRAAARIVDALLEGPPR